jgi:5'-deoxynucleotidase
MTQDFFALTYRMRYIGRWGLMRNSESENVAEHSHDVAVFAHALAVIARDDFGKDCNPDRCASIAMLHDASEIFTGDLPTPIKYHNEDLTRSYKEIEQLAADRLLGYLPEKLRGEYAALLSPDETSLEYRLVKAADKLSAYIKCVEERRAGNGDFLSAEEQTLSAMKKMQLQELDYFIENFLPSFEKTLDELGSL